MNYFLQHNFNNCTLEYDLEKYNWTKLILAIIQEKFPQVDRLETLHQRLEYNQIADVTKLVQNRFLDHNMSKLFDEFAEEYISPLLGNSRYLIKRQPTLNVVIPHQSKAGRRLPFHQGIFYDNGRGQGTIWMPLTRSYESNTMWIMDLYDSKKLTKSVIEQKWNLTQFEEQCLQKSFPVTLNPGQAHLFAQEHIHGNIENVTDITRVAVDWHILVEGEEYHRRYPGAFFRLPGDYVEQNRTEQSGNSICYLSNNSEIDKNVGKHAQRCVIEHYVKSQNIQHNGYQFENEYLEHLPIFDYLLDQDIDAIIVFSVYSITDDLLRKALAKNKTIHFANEYTSMKTQEDLNKLLVYKNFAVSKKGKLHFE